ADLRLRIYSLYQFLYYHLRSVRVRLISLTIPRSCSAAEHPKRTRATVTPAVQPWRRKADHPSSLAWFRSAIAVPRLRRMASTPMYRSSLNGSQRTFSSYS
ncbi:hypothetical protein IscW_ISCW010791, partial [Ixodes scapularis]